MEQFFFPPIKKKVSTRRRSDWLLSAERWHASASPVFATSKSQSETAIGIQQQTIPPWPNKDAY